MLLSFVFMVRKCRIYSKGVGRGWGINQKYNAKLVEFARNLCNTDSWN